MIDMQLARRFMIRTMRDLVWIRENLTDEFTDKLLLDKLSNVQEGLVLLTYILHMDEIDLININDKP